MTTSKCYLDSLNLDMVTETDHLHNYCYCSKCTCGHHICPKPSSRRYPKSTFNSFYKLNYKRHSVSNRPISSSTTYRKSQFKLQSETTSSHDFQAWDVDKSFNVNTPNSKTQKSGYKLSSSSIYKQDFTDRGMMKTEMIKQVSIPVATGIKFNATTTYSNFFASSPGKPSKMATPHVNTNILCTSGNTKPPESTTKANYSKHAPYPTHQVIRGDNTMPLPAFPNQYATVNSVNFNAKEISATIRRARRSLD